ncbi:MAG: flagellar hook-associated protein FlgK [Xanthobacteraceae bacterium]
MGLSQALFTAMSGLRANQAALALVSSNVANAETPGYVRKETVQVATTAGEMGTGVLVTGVNRTLDQYIQSQLRTELSGAAYAGVRAAFLSSLQSLYGNPGSSGTLEAAFNGFTGALQGLSTSPDSPAARIAVLNAASVLAQQLNVTSQGIQAQRANADAGIADSVRVANNAMTQIAAINGQLLRGGAADASTAALLDQRDAYIEQLAQLMDIKVIANENNQLTVFTSAGVQLVGTEAAKLNFQSQGMVTAQSQWDSDPAKSTLGSVTIDFPQGGSMDLIASNGIRSGKIAAYFELRDKTLVQAQAQLDQLAASMASALSDKTTAGAAASVGAQSGFDLDLAGMLSGNTIHLTYTDVATGTQRNVSIIRVDDASVLPLPQSATADPNDQVIGIDFSGGMASVVAQLNAALGPALQFSNPAGDGLRILDDGAANTVKVDAASVTKTADTLTGGDPQLPLFTDGGFVYSGAYTAAGAQQNGFAARIAVNTALIGDPSRTIVFGAGTAAGDTTRPDFLFTQLTAGVNTFDPATGIGSTTSPYRGTLLTFIQQVTGMQGDAAVAAKQLADGQNVVLNTLQQKMDAVSGVNIDEEMAHLLALQNAYGANARVMAAVRDMYAMLMQSM